MCDVMQTGTNYVRMSAERRTKFNGKRLALCARVRSHEVCCVAHFLCFSVCVSDVCVCGMLDAMCVYSRSDYIGN